MTDKSAVTKMVTQIKNEVCSVDILVKNAGIIKRVPMTEMAAEDFRQVIDVDLTAPSILSKAVIPDMIKKVEVKLLTFVQ